MSSLVFNFAVSLFALLVISGHALAQRMRGDVAVGASRQRMPSGGASDVA